ncbi:hypothetical protein IV73_GL000221 [Weissella kandleri]|uniref:Catabolite control protein A n=1 Tax=Weissella kandleri TaxID=1616 RepID=A0A0R2JEE0_9LACO|nr:catabolite control protein A [Weissella kandleri]KRN75726.1 hypothetical protein IV73_GL000221 [Weissella kandleri]
MEKQTVTIYDVAREAGVSMATVSRVVNGNTNVRAETKEKVEAVIERLDYRPNAVARGLASRKSTTIGIIVPDVTNVYFSELARGIDDVAQMYNYQIILTNSDEKNNSNVFESLLGKQVEGILYMGNIIDDNLRDKIKKNNVPVVLSGSVDVEKQLPSVNIDYVSAMYEVTKHLIEHGHQKIAFVSGPLDETINTEFKFKGYQKALVEAGLDYTDDLLVSGDYNYQSGYQLGAMVHDSGATAAVVVDDEMAAGVLNYMTDQDVVTPDDFEIVTLNNSHITLLTRPQLSSVTQPIYDIGAVSMRMLTKLMNGEELDTHDMILPHGYAGRGTTK